MGIIRTTGTAITARITATIVPTIIAGTTPIIAHIAITATTVGTDITGSGVPQTESPVQGRTRLSEEAK
jgi:phage-related minor tail protein